MIQIIPTTTDPFSSQLTTLEGSTFVLSFAYNSRCSCWYLSIADSQGVDIYNGVKLVTKRLLLRKCADPRKPAGDFYLVSRTLDSSPPQLADLDPNSGRCRLYYVTSDWLNAGADPDAILAQLATNTQGGTQSTYGQA